MNAERHTVTIETERTGQLVLTPGEAMTLANSLKRRFPEASFVVGAY